MKLNTYQSICLGFTLSLVVFWLTLFTTNTTAGFSNYLFSFLFGLIPLCGGIVAMYGSRTWGGLRSALGKAVFLIGLGIFLWGCGELIWSYYNFFAEVAAPYPSLADLGFAPSILFYGIGAIYLAQVTGAKFGLRNKIAKFFVVIAPVAIFLFSYYILIVIARGGVLVPEGETALKTILDIAYPLGDFVSLTIAVIVSGLSFKYLGGKYTYDIVSIWIGLAVMFIADSIFSYTTTVGTYYNGNFGDLLLTLGLFFITFGVLGFSKYEKSPVKG
ncbi:MAG: hypothetical protein V4438_01050 [Patescibacteria group bacterium]